ncbi:uncharacterized protein [Choristoneura fumiferana]|uniref:uncharacterized protein n=1 Tax=Choristoneura fumiferana TaxID=7141 RepID=UPI003D15CF6F
MFFLISCILNLIAATTCSIVFDRANQNAIYIKDYCPKMEHCPEGTHVLCMYHDAVNVMGPRCNNGQNITMTEQFKDMLLDMINEIRSSAAKGNEVGKDGQLLPRAYGMHRLAIQLMKVTVRSLTSHSSAAWCPGTENDGIRPQYSGHGHE